MPDPKSFLDKLITKSQQGRVPWRPATESDMFTASLGTEFTVTVSKTGVHMFAFELRDQRDQKLIQMSAGKTEAWEQGYEEALEHYDRLRQLYEVARDFALDVPKQLTRAETLLDEA
jgi:hypothetical protein